MTKSALPTQFDPAEEARYAATFDTLVDAAVSEPEAAAIATQWVASPVGPLLIGATETTLQFLEFSGTDELAERLSRLRKHFSRPLVRKDNAILGRLRAQLGEYFAGARRDFDVPLEFHGSEFQERVWAALRTIPYG